MDTFSELLKRRRKERGLSVRALQKALNDQGHQVSFSFISFLEHERKMPSYEMAYSISIILDIDIDEALASAYKARVEYDEKREKENLKRFIEKKKLTKLRIEDITAKR